MEFHPYEEAGVGGEKRGTGKEEHRLTPKPPLFKKRKRGVAKPCVLAARQRPGEPRRKGRN
jgi:hypothetical protein